MKEEQETFVDKEQRLIHEQKEKELQRKIEITRQYEEKQLEILVIILRFSITIFAVYSEKAF